MTRRTGITAKLGLVMGAMTVIIMLVATVLFVQLRQITTTYDGILGSEVRSALQARQMQVEFKKQVQEWKDILLRGFNPDDLATYTTQFHDESATVDQLGNALLTTTADEGVRAEVRQFLVEHDTLNQNYEAALAPFVAAGAKDPTVPDKAVRGQDRPPTNRIDGIVSRLETAVADRVAAQNARVATQQRVLAVVGIIALLFLLATLAFVVASIVRPVRELTRAAYQAAHQALPDAIGRIRRSSGDDVPELPAIEVRSRDELRDLADALSSLQSSAVRLAVDQHRAERRSAEILVNLGRRNQSLLKRTLGYISELEADEHDPDVLARLFRLDHATTRIRRNAESMLVLAGAEQTRTWSRPVPVTEVVRAALSEIEDYTRVDPHHIEDAALSGTAIADIVHLIAELAENATHFSPPESRVAVVGRRLPEGYRLRVVDRGVGMTAAELDAANARITQAAGERTDSPMLGLHVVGRLAARHGITVALEPSAGTGTTASITFPTALLVEATPPAGLPAPAHDTPTAQHGIPVAQLVPAQGVPTPARSDADRTGPAPLSQPQIPRPRSPRSAATRPTLPAPAMALTRASVRTSLVLDPLPEMPEPRGCSWEVPPDSASAPPGTVTGWFHALAEPGPETPDLSAEPAADIVEPVAGPSGIPRRIRGAQLPDLGDARSGQEFLAPDPDQVRRPLSALHVGVERAQAEQSGQP